MDELKQAAKLVPKSIDNAVENLTDPVTKEAGTTFGDIWFLVFGGIHEAAEKKRMRVANNLKEFKDELTKAVDAIPPEHRREPNLQTIGPALEHSKYCIEEEKIRAMFTALISNSLDDRYDGPLHPSFSHIISQLNSLDARTLNLFKDNPHKTFPIVEYQMPISSQGFKLIKTNVFLSVDPDCDIDSQATSIAVLEQLGLAKVSYDSLLADPEAYDIFRSSPSYVWYQEAFEEYKIDNPEFASNDSINIVEGTVELTPLGIAFVNACIC